MADIDMSRFDKQAPRPADPHCWKPKQQARRSFKTAPFNLAEAADWY